MNLGAQWIRMEPSSVVTNVIVVTILVLIANHCTKGVEGCFFPQEYHGSYVVQYPAPEGQSSHFSEVTVMVDSIPVWGVCAKRLGNNVLLRDRTRTTECVRCFRLQLHSVNVLHIHTEGLDKCYATEEAAMASCPTDDVIGQDKSQEILLYRKPGAESVLQQVFCPINGRYKFTYSTEHNEQQCREPVSELSNCPYGFILTAKFRQCSFSDREVSFQCLGDWEGANGQKYLALLDPSPPPSAATAGSGGPRYRCAMYGRDPNGQITMSISPDSTCATLKKNVTIHETFQLTPVVAPSWPASAQKSNCKFPEWAEGEWQQIRIEGDALTYTDPHNFQSYTMRCLQEKEKGNDEQRKGRFLVYARTQCGDETYNCLTMSYRGKLAMEFQIGQYPSLHYNQSLCNDDQFASRSWIAQGRIKSTKRSSCPIAGDYTGYIPDATGLCAKLSSDCHNPETMFYTVSNCNTKNEIYEEREYRCLGEWEEDGVLYAFTQRKDLQGFQCFVGKIVDGQDVFIKEAGDNCVRGMDPMKFGMKMTKQGSCDPDTAADMPHPNGDDLPTSTNKSQLAIPTRTTQRSSVTAGTTTSTKPWRPITATPSEEQHPSSSAVKRVTTWLIMLAVFTTTFLTVLDRSTSSQRTG